MNRETILELLLKDSSHDELINRLELYSHDSDIYEWMVASRDYWNKRIPKLIENRRKVLEKCAKEDERYMELLNDNYLREKALLSYHLAASMQRRFANEDIACFWRSLLTQRPEFANRCPWKMFRGDLIWMTLGDEDFFRALAVPKVEIARKMALKLMSRPDWDELLKIVPELQEDFDGLEKQGYKFEALC